MNRFFPAIACVLMMFSSLASASDLSIRELPSFRQFMIQGEASQVVTLELTMKFETSDACNQFYLESSTREMDAYLFINTELTQTRIACGSGHPLQTKVLKTTVDVALNPGGYKQILVPAGVEVELTP